MLFAIFCILTHSAGTYYTNCHYAVQSLYITRYRWIFSEKMVLYSVEKHNRKQTRENIRPISTWKRAPFKTKVKLTCIDYFHGDRKTERERLMNFTFVLKFARTCRVAHQPHPFMSYIKNTKYQCLRRAVYPSPVNGAD